MLLSEIKFLFCNSAQTKNYSHTYAQHGNKIFYIEKDMKWEGWWWWCVGWFVGFLLWNEKLTLILVPSSRACKPFKFILSFFVGAAQKYKYNHSTAEKQKHEIDVPKEAVPEIECHKLSSSSLLNHHHHHHCQPYSSFFVKKHQA